MAKKGSRGGEPNKSQMIRDFVKEHPELGPTAVAQALQQQGVAVTPAFVSTVKSSSAKGPPKKPGRKPGPKPGRQPQAGGETVELETLLKAKRLAEQMGGIEQAKSALDAYARLLS